MTTERHRLIADALGRSPTTILKIDDWYDFGVPSVDDDWVFRFPRRSAVEDALEVEQAFAYARSGISPELGPGRGVTDCGWLPA